MSCKSCHTCGTAVRVVLDGEEWCDTCQTYQRPASHGWGRFPGQTRAELLSCQDAIDWRIGEQISRLTNALRDFRYDLYVSSAGDPSKHVEADLPLIHHALHVKQLIPLLYAYLLKNRFVRVTVANPNSPSVHTSEPIPAPNGSRAVSLPLSSNELHALDGLLSTAFADPDHGTLLSAFLPDWTEILVPLHRKITELAGHRSPSPGTAP